MTFKEPKYLIAARLRAEGLPNKEIARRIKVKQERVSNLIWVANGRKLQKPPRGKVRSGASTGVAGTRQKRRSGAPIRPRKALGPQAEAIIYLGQACDLLQAGYRLGDRVREPDPLVFLALSALTKRRPK